MTDRHHAQSPESANAAGKNGKEKPAQLGFMWGNRYCSMSSWLRLPGTCTATCNTQRKPRALSQLPRVHHGEQVPTLIFKELCTASVLRGSRTAASKSAANEARMVESRELPT